MIVIWKEKNLRLRVLEVIEGRQGELRYSVCKETAPNPVMGRFSVRVDEVEPSFQ